ncbi:MAG TPA: arsenosugar biosynthesis radical SAM (seleno)protein ArsS [Candidatus Thermoplasmatota archaeon]|nr:arsenosugar biosynthesis radical SAM (seleno)protein ArsS [Candidatus Thermoplasmatota archaeon]
MNEFDKKIMETIGQELSETSLNTLQVNIGLRCNQECRHCHLVASPNRKEMMSWETMMQVLTAAAAYPFALVDITGGAPEMNPSFIKFISALREKDYPTQVRTNLTVLHDIGVEKMAQFYADNNIQLIASLPCYLEEEVRLQRGEGIFEQSIEALTVLNDVGYGTDSLVLNLMFNPLEPVLPPEQTVLEQDYHRELLKNFGIRFSHLLTLTNMPIGRFLTHLKATHQEEAYRKLLKDSFNPVTVERLMCRSQIEVGWDGTLYDCDFNLAQRLPVDTSVPRHVKYFNPAALSKRKIVTGTHCFGCTAGHGSSCGGALLK